MFRGNENLSRPREDTNYCNKLQNGINKLHTEINLAKSNLMLRNVTRRHENGKGEKTLMRTQY